MRRERVHRASFPRVVQTHNGGPAALARRPMTVPSRAATLHTEFGDASRRSEGLELGIVLALACAVATQLGFLCKHRGAAWILHIGALAMAPLSTVQVALSTGVVILAVLGDRLFGHDVGTRQWLGV